MEEPQDPVAVQLADGRLRRAWRACRAQAYPADIGWGSGVIRNTVTFTRSEGKRLTASVRLDVAKRAEGNKYNPAPSHQTVRGFVSCVRNRFKGADYGDGGSRVGPGTRYSLPTPSYGGPLVGNDGKLAASPAAEHVLHQLESLRSSCEIPQGKQWRVVVAVAPDGEVETVQAKPFRSPSDKTKEEEPSKDDKIDLAGSCIEKKLGNTLRFPVSEHGAEVGAQGP